MTDQPIETENQCSYIIHPKHRDGKDPDASQWIISEDEEKKCFELSLNSTWINPNGAKNLCIEGEFGWRIKISTDKTLEFLGHTGKIRGQKKVKLAKLQETRLYLYCIIENKILKLLKIGDKNTQSKDIQYCKNIVEQINKGMENEKSV